VFAYSHGCPPTGGLVLWVPLASVLSAPRWKSHGWWVAFHWPNMHISCIICIINQSILYYALLGIIYYALMQAWMDGWIPDQSYFANGNDENAWKHPRAWKMTEWQSKRMTYNIWGVSMLCQLTSLVIGSDERGDIPNKHNWGINWPANDAY